jgi:DNA-binding CsgD family transcriptional regulator
MQTARGRQENWDGRTGSPCGHSQIMSAMERLTGSPEHRSSPLAERLSARELEVLRLLAEGHTIKSIAAQLGRTEASINERLRDARRKTGVGSSRELARQLGAQKIWNRNPDLANTSPQAEGSVEPASRGLTGPKGTIAMLIAMPLIAAGSLLMAADAPYNAARPGAAPAAATAARTSPLIGRWALDTTRVPAEERPQSVTISFSVAADQRWTTHVAIVNPDGAALHAGIDCGARCRARGDHRQHGLHRQRLAAPACDGHAGHDTGQGWCAGLDAGLHRLARSKVDDRDDHLGLAAACPKLETNTFRRIS